MTKHKRTPSIDSHLNSCDVENFVFIQSIIERQVTIYYDRASRNFRFIETSDIKNDKFEQLAKEDKLVEKAVSKKYPHKRRISDVDIELQWKCYLSDVVKDQDPTYDPLAFFIAGIETTDVVLLTCTI